MKRLVSCQCIKRSIHGLLIFMAFQATALAQEKEDTATLASAFRKGKVQGNLRNALLMTNNAPGLTDYRADAIGGHLLYQTASFKGFRLTAGAHVTFPLFSSGLSKPDPATGALNRYEGTLFDVTRPSGKRALAMMSLLHLTWQFKQGKVVAGRQWLNTPFINGQDNRMQPSVVEGLYADISLKKWRLEGGWLSRIAPRGTMRWFSIAGSLGLYPQGTNADSSKGNYFNNAKSKGVGLLGGHYQPGENLHLQVWEQYADNLFNTVLLQADFKLPSGEDAWWLLGLQYIRQDIVHDGGHADPALTYFSNGNKVHVTGARTGWENKRFRVLLNYTRIGAGGRFTMPREWGTEPFFTFLNRERNEGAGDIQAASATVRWEFPQQRLAIEGGYGRYYMPGVKQYALNKYGVPSYSHSKVAIDYVCSGLLQHLKLSALYIYKSDRGDTYGNLKYVINKVNMSHFALIVNYPFDAK